MIVVFLLILRDDIEGPLRNVEILITGPTGTGTGAGAGVELATVIATEEVKKPSRVVAVMIEDPTEIPVTKPVADTVAAVEEENHVTFLFVALAFVIAVN